MDDAKRRALIRVNAAKKKESVGANPMGTGSSLPQKRKVPSRGDRLPKKPKVPLEPILGLMADAKTTTPLKHGARKGLMTGPSTQKEKAPVLLREDPKYALEKLSFVISPDDYEDLGNHSMEAMGETGLFNIAQAMLMMKGLMGRCLSHETTLDRLREKAKATDDELTQLRAWKAVQEKKLKMAEGVRDEYFKKTKELSKVLEDKEKEICQAKVDAVREYRDSNDLLLEPGSSFNDGFDDAFRQVKSLYPDLDLSSVNISVPEQTSV
ncbi:uncharacterized protein LOC112038720 isoform X1 [Quercus suber]|uniref:uncharacterized protein LOC112038720 isoform X1 n=1 Tax=Quercus suber TaxID=58331 RepID=UPI0032DFB6A5